MATCSVCRWPIYGQVACGPDGRRAHWGCAELANEELRALRNQPNSGGDDAPVEVRASAQANALELAWLEPWLESKQLSRCLPRAAEWCESMGATCVQEVLENWEDFVKFLGLDIVQDASADQAGGRQAGSTELAWLEPWLESKQMASCLSRAAAWCQDMGATCVEEVLENWEDFVQSLGLEAAQGASTTGSTATSSSSSSGDVWLDSAQLPQTRPLASPQLLVETFGPEGAQYQMLEQLGRGANAVVHRCVRGTEHFAVKVINLQRLRMRPDCERVLRILDRETSILWTLHHKRIVQLHDVVRTPERLYLVMELVEGGELMDKIMQGKMTEDEARHVFVQIVEGLKYIHGKNIVHRDLKPENILVDSAASRPGSLEVKLSDFGHSKFINDGYTRARTVVGTPQYWAPEAAEARFAGPQGYDERADLWSLGVVLYVMLEGSYPFNGTSAARSAHFDFHGSGAAETLLRGLIRVDPAERWTLDQCMECAWVASGEPLVAGARPEAEEEHEVRVKLPRSPVDVGLFKADLAAFSNEQQVPAKLIQQEVIVGFRPGAGTESVDRTRRALDEVLTRHFPELGKKPENAAAAARLEECKSLEAIYGREFEAVSELDWRVEVCPGSVLRLDLPRGYPREVPPNPMLEGPPNDEVTAFIEDLPKKWTLGDTCIYQWTERVREILRGSNAAANVCEGDGKAEDEEVEGTLPCEGVADFKFSPPPSKQAGRGPKSAKQGQRARNGGAENPDPQPGNGKSPSGGTVAEESTALPPEGAADAKHPAPLKQSGRGGKPVKQGQRSRTAGAEPSAEPQPSNSSAQGAATEESNASPPEAAADSKQPAPAKQPGRGGKPVKQGQRSRNAGTEPNAEPQPSSSTAQGAAVGARAGQGGVAASQEPSAAPAQDAAADFIYVPPNKTSGRAPKSVKQGQRARNFGTESVDPQNSVDILHGETISDKGSRFQGHLAAVCSKEQVNWAHRELLSDKRIGDATHNTYAYRFRDQNGGLVADCDDDNEKGAGALLAQLLDNCGDQGAFVMVSRWYGGTMLGPDRYKHLKNAAQQLIKEHGFLKPVAAPTKKRAGAKKG